MKKILLILLMVWSTLYANLDIDKALSSELRAEVYAQSFLDGGYYKEVNTFLTEAIQKYPNNATLLMFKGTALFNLKDPDSAKKYFILTLENDSRNEQASDFISLIEDQEAAQANKAIKRLIDYLGDKGLDFLMIFIAFLGGEIMARKYAKCSSQETISIINKFKERKVLSRNFLSRVKFSLIQCCFSRTLFSFCFFLEVLVTLTIIIVLLIVLFVIEFVFEVSIFLGESFSTLTTEAIWSHTIDSVIYLGLITLSLRFLMKVLEYNSEEEDYVIEVADELQQLYSSQSYKHFYAAITSLSNDDYKLIKDFLHNNEIKETIERFKYPKSSIN